MASAKKTRKHRNRNRRKSRYRKRGGGADTKKLAILFYGRISSYEHSLEYINSVYKNPRFTSVVFCSLNLKNKSEYITNFCKEFSITDEQINIEPTPYPESYDKDPHNKVFCATDTNCVNTYSTYYHQNKAFKLMEKYQKHHNMVFDIVLMFRADTNARDAPNVFPIGDTIAPNTVYIPKPIGAAEIGPGGVTREEFEVHRGSNCYSDGLTTLAAYGNMEAMKKYASLVEHIKTELNHPERMLFKHLQDMEVNVERFGHEITLNPERRDTKYPTE